jgi:hypothetical protein
MNQLVAGAILLICCPAFFAGCAATAQHASLVGKPDTTAAGATKVLFLSMNGRERDESLETVHSRLSLRPAPVRVGPERERATVQKTTLVDVKNDLGRTIAKRVIPVYAGDILIDALKHELVAAGYTVRSVQQMPKNENGIDVSLASAELTQNTGLLTLEGTCNLHIKLDEWRNGSKVKSRDYVSDVSDYSFSDRDRLFVDLIIMSAQNIMKQAEPDIQNDFTAMRN